MNKIYLITGTSKGIGKYLCEHYLAQDNIVIGCSRSEKSITNKNYFHYTLDISQEKSVMKMVSEIIKKFGEIDVLINNAGIASLNHFILSPLSKAEEIFRTNYFGTFIVMQQVAKTMIRNKYGRIINFTTVAVPLNLEGEAIYASSKSAVETLTKITAKELASYNITVNAIGLTPVKTNLIENIPKEKIEKLIERQAFKRYGEMKDIINSVDFFINENSNYITGQILYLGGVY